jgi:hypothetical protein
MCVTLLLRWQAVDCHSVQSVALLSAAVVYAFQLHSKALAVLDPGPSQGPHGQAALSIRSSAHSFLLPMNGATLAPSLGTPPLLHACALPDSGHVEHQRASRPDRCHFQAMI